MTRTNPGQSASNYCCPRTIQAIHIQPVPYSLNVRRATQCVLACTPDTRLEHASTGEDNHVRLLLLLQAFVSSLPMQQPSQSANSSGKNMAPTEQTAGTTCIGGDVERLRVRFDSIQCTDHCQAQMACTSCTQGGTSEADTVGTRLMDDASSTWSLDEQAREHVKRTRGLAAIGVDSFANVHQAQLEAISQRDNALSRLHEAETKFLALKSELHDMELASRTAVALAQTEKRRELCAQSAETAAIVEELRSKATEWELECSIIRAREAGVQAQLDEARSTLQQQNARLGDLVRWRPCPPRPRPVQSRM
jgi:hypothetical protein